jgi:hypothetical protein
MTRPSLKRFLIIAGIVVIAGGVAPFLPLPFLRPGIEQALARRLGRRVDIDQVSLSLFGGPGFSLSGVIIHEDPRAGIEPFAYAQSVDARVDLLGLLAGRRGFSSLRFGDATLNLVRTRAGEWNFQYLLNARLSDVPSIHLRGARMNLKFGQTKSVLYFDDADLDISPGDQGSLDLRFSGAPARTDRSAQDFGHLFVRASWIPASADRPLNVKVEWEPSSLDGLAKLFGRSWFDLQGQVSLNAQLAGTPSHLAVTGEVQLDEGRRSDFLPSREGKWDLPYRGTLDLMAEKLELESILNANASNATPPNANADANVPPFAARLEAGDLLTSPQWRASVEFNEAPLATVADAARRVGAPLPAKLSAEGMVSGHLQYEAESGLTGNLEAREAALAMPDSPVVRSISVPITIAAQTISFGPCAVSLHEKVPDQKAAEKSDEKPGEGQSAQVEASYKFDGSAAAEFKITTRGMDLGGLRTFASVPLLGQATVDASVHDRAAPDRRAKATWRGTIYYQRSGRYQSAGAEEGAWTGDYSVENARIAVDGIADPVRILSANISAGAGRLAVTKMKAKAGDIAFTGEYRWDSKAGNASSKDSQAGDFKADRPHKFKLQIGEATMAELDRLFKPTLVRGGGFIERTLRLGSASPAPDWLAQRKAEGTVTIAALIAGDHKLAVDSARVVWDGASVRLSAIDGHMLDSNAEGATLKGELNVDLSEGAPQYRLTGKVGGVPYNGGRLDFEGRIEAAGDGPPLLASLRATGTLNGRSIAFSPDADFRNVSGHFQASLQGTSPRWKFTDLEVTQGSDVYLGEGAAQADGKIVLDLMNRGKQFRYTGSLVSAAAQP